MSLTGGSQDQPSLFTDDARPVIQADKSAFEDLLEGAREIMGKADKTLTTIEQVVSQNAPEVSKTIKNVEQFSDALAANSDAVRTLFADVGRAANVIADLSDRLQGIVGRAEEIIAEVKPGQVETIVDNAVAFSNSLENAGKQVDALMADISAGAKSLQTFLDGLDSSLAAVNRVIDSVPADSVKRIVESLDDLTVSLAGQRETISMFIDQATDAAGNINRISETLAQRTDDIDATITNIRTFTDEIDQIAKNLTPIVSDAGRILGGERAEGRDHRPEHRDRDEQPRGARRRHRQGDRRRGGDGGLGAQVRRRRRRPFRRRRRGGRAGPRADDERSTPPRPASPASSTRSTPGRRRREGLRRRGDAGGAGDPHHRRGLRTARQCDRGRTDAVLDVRADRPLRHHLAGARLTLMSIQNAVQGLERDPSRIIYGGSNQPTCLPQRR